MASFANYQYHSFETSVLITIDVLPCSTFLHICALFNCFYFYLFNLQLFVCFNKSRFRQILGVIWMLHSHVFLALDNALMMILQYLTILEIELWASLNWDIFIIIFVMIVNLTKHYWDKSAFFGTSFWFNHDICLKYFLASLWF